MSEGEFILRLFFMGLFCIGMIWFSIQMLKKIPNNATKRIKEE